MKRIVSRAWIFHTISVLGCSMRAWGAHVWRERPTGASHPCATFLLGWRPCRLGNRIGGVTRLERTWRAREGGHPLAAPANSTRLQSRGLAPLSANGGGSRVAVSELPGSQYRAPLRQLVSCGLILLLLMIFSSSARGQENPFGETASPKPAASAVGEETEEEEEEGGDTEASKIEELLADEEDPLVLAIVETRPETPPGLFRDVRALLNVDRFELAQEYLRQWLATEPDNAEMIRIEAELGAAFFLRLTNIDELQPIGAEVAGKVMEAAGERFYDPARLSALVKQLSDSDPAQQRAAQAELVKAGSVAAVPMIKALADPSRAAEHGPIQNTLVAMGDEAVPPLLAALRGGNESLRLQAIALLAKLKSKEAVPTLLPTAWPAEPNSDPATVAAREMIRNVLGALPSRDEAIRFLSERLENLLGGAVPGPIDHEQQVTEWAWDVTGQAPRRRVLSVGDASILSAARVAEQLHRMARTTPSSAASIWPRHWRM